MALELEIRDVEAGYGAVRALHKVSLSIKETETVALLGTNGNGKSTLMKCVMGMVTPTKGSITLTVDGESHDLASLSTEEIVDLGVAMVPEGRRLFPKLTVEENLLLGAYRSLARRDIEKNRAFSYEIFPILAERRRQLAGSLSGGQQQMLAIARALMSSPKLLLVDEPSVGLAPILVSHTIATIKQLKERYGLTVLMAEQNFHQAIRIADRGYLIVHGEIVFGGRVAELEQNPLVKNYYLGVRSLRNLHIGMYGAVMGLAGLGLTARAAATLFPGTVRAPAYFTELWVGLGALALIILLPLYLLKIIFFREAVKEDFTNPALLGLCGALPVGMTLVAGGIGPYLPALGDALWWTGCAWFAAFAAWGLVRWLSGAIELASLNAGWLILLVGGIVVPGPGIALGHAEASRYFFGFSTCAAGLLMPLLFYRAGMDKPLAEGLRPTWFILLVPPSLIYANGLALYPDSVFLENLFFFATLLAIVLFAYARGFARWPFGPAWWAFTFPLDAFAYAAVRYAHAHPSPLWKTVAALALAAATLFVVMVLARNLLAARYLFSKRL